MEPEVVNSATTGVDEHSVEHWGVDQRGWISIVWITEVWISGGNQRSSRGTLWRVGRKLCIPLWHKSHGMHHTFRRWLCAQRRAGNIEYLDAAHECSSLQVGTSGLAGRRLHYCGPCTVGLRGLLELALVSIGTASVPLSVPPMRPLLEWMSVPTFCGHSTFVECERRALKMAQTWPLITMMGAARSHRCQHQTAACNSCSNSRNNMQQLQRMVPLLDLWPPIT